MTLSKNARVFSRTINGEVVTQVATAPADVVRYTYDGWHDVTDEVNEAAAVAKEIAAKESGSKSDSGTKTSK